MVEDIESSEGKVEYGPEEFSEAATVILEKEWERNVTKESSDSKIAPNATDDIKENTNVTEIASHENVEKKDDKD